MSTQESSTSDNDVASQYRLPSNNTLQHAAKIAVVDDKPIMFDYWMESLEKTVLIGVRQEGETVGSRRA